MATLQTVVTRIGNDYLNRTDLDSEIVRQVQAAIRHYERRRWPWNEATTTLTCVSSQSYIDVPSDFLVLDFLEVQYQSSNLRLMPRSFEEIASMNSYPSSVSVPTHFAQRGNRFYLAITPDSAYPVNCYYIKQLATLSAMSDTNKWLSAAEDLVVYHATKNVWAKTLRNTAEAMVFAQLEAQAETKVAGIADQRAGCIKPTQF